MVLGTEHRIRKFNIVKQEIFICKLTVINSVQNQKKNQRAVFQCNVYDIGNWIYEKFSSYNYVRREGKTYLIKLSKGQTFVDVILLGIVANFSQWFYLWFNIKNGKWKYPVNTASSFLWFLVVCIWLFKKNRFFTFKTIESLAR